MTDANLTLQTAIYTALTGDAPLMAVISAVYDDVPKNPSYPFIELADIDSNDAGSKTYEGLDHDIDIHIWSTYHGQIQIFEIMELIDNVLHDQDLALTGHDMINMRRTNRTTVRDIDPSIRHGIMSYRVLTHAN